MNRQTAPGPYERKDAGDAGDPAALVTEVKKAVDGLGRGFEEFKATNDERLKQIEKKGAADAVTSDKLDKIEKSLSAYEGLNQRLVTAEATSTKQAEVNKQVQEALTRIETKVGRPGAGGGDNADDKEVKAYQQSWEIFLRTEPTAFSQKAEHVKMLTERKALIAGNDALGGYYLSPPQMVTEIIKGVIEQSPLRALATVTPIGVQSLKLPKRTGTFAARRVSEIGARSETTGYTTGMIEIPAPELYAEVHISQQQIEDSAFDMEAEMRLEFAEQFAVKEGSEFLTGIGGAEQCLGILNTTGVLEYNSGSAANITADGLINVAHGIKTPYARAAVWLLNRLSLGAVRKLKDGEGNYLWQPGLAAGIPNNILGHSYAEMADMPNEAAGTTPIAFGDPKRYRITDRIDLQVMRDPFSQGAYGLILFRARKRVGGMLTLGESFAKLKCAS